MKKINNYHLSLLLMIVFIINTILFQSIKITQGQQFRPPTQLPGEGAGASIVTSPLSASLDLGEFDIFGEGSINIGGVIHSNNIDDNSYTGAIITGGKSGISNWFNWDAAPSSVNGFKTLFGSNIWTDNGITFKKHSDYDAWSIFMQGANVGWQDDTDKYISFNFKDGSDEDDSILGEELMKLSKDGTLEVKNKIKTGRLFLGADTGGNPAYFLNTGGILEDGWHLSFNHSSDESFSIVESGILQRITVERGGNVGIGTINPNKNLHIYDTRDGDFNAEINLQSVGIPDDGSHWGIYHDSNTDDLRFWHEKGDTESVAQADDGEITTIEENRLNITADGDLGIGVTEPSERLEIVEDDGNGAAIIIQANRPINHQGNALGEIKFRASENNGLTSGVGGQIGYQSNDDWVVGSTPAYMYISTTPNGETNDVQRFKIAANGNIGLGDFWLDGSAQGEPQAKLHVYKGDSGVSETYKDHYATAVFENDNHSMIEIWSPIDKQGGFYFSDPEIGIMSEFVYSHGNDTFRFASHPDITSGWSTHMLIDGPTGNVIIGGEEAESAGTVAFYDTGDGRFDYEFNPEDSPGGDRNIIEISNHYPGPRRAEGKFISYGDHGVWADITSDYRLKQNVEDLDIGLGMINLLEPKKFQFKSSPNKNKTGFIAHEVGKLIPNAVIGEKDAVNEDGSIDPQFLQRNEIIPYLVKAVQELSAEITSLKNQLNNNN